MNLADALDGQCLGILARVQAERARREPYMRQVGSRPQPVSRTTRLMTSGQVCGPNTFVGVGWVVLRDDTLGAEAADDRGHVGDQPLGDQLAVGRIIGVQRHVRIGSQRRDQVDVDQRGTRLRQERLDLAPVRRLPGLAVRAPSIP